MFDPEREQVRKTYQLCRWASRSSPGALVLACFTSVSSCSDTSSTSLANAGFMTRPGSSGSTRRSFGAADRDDSALGTLGS